MNCNFYLIWNKNMVEYVYIGSAIIDNAPNYPINIKKELNISKININSIKLNKLIEEYNINKINHLFICTEEYDYDILICYDFKIKPFKITFGIAHMNEDKFINLSNKLIENNYKITKTDNTETEFELS